MAQYAFGSLWGSCGDFRSIFGMYFIPFWDHIVNKYEINKKYGIEKFRRIYFNAHTYGIEPRPHIDDGDFTMMYYPVVVSQRDPMAANAVNQTSRKRTETYS